MANDQIASIVGTVTTNAPRASPAVGMEVIRVALDGIRAQAPALDRVGLRDCLRRLEPEFAAVLPRGTSVVVEFGSLEFVHAPTRAAALRAFIARFGRHASGWAFDVGVPVSVGGGVCAS